MNKKLLILLVLIALAVYYLNEEKRKPKTLLTSSEPWIIPQTIPAQTSTVKKVEPASPSKPKESKIEFPSNETAEEPLETDYSWLTDDNLEFILKNWTPVKEALTRQNSSSRKFSLRTDIANLYNCFYKARDNQAWDLPEFLERLEDNKHQYTLFPLRVNGNHWGLFILSEEEPKPTPPMPGSSWLEPASWVETKVYYTSSGGEDLSAEKKQLQPFINQIVGENTPITIIQPKDRNSKGYECGVYLCFYVREILESGKLELTRTYSEAECQAFRKEWKEKIGEKWGRWD